jgi:steroid delta-isomerase-like uncharacterized protein
MKKLLMVILFVSLFCFTFACQDKEAMAELEAMKAQTEVEEQNKAFYRSLIEEMNKGSLELYNEFYAPDFLYYLPSNNPKPMSLEETKEFMKMVHKAFPDINWSIEELFTVGDRVIIRIIVRGTHEGEFQGIPATGNKIEVSEIIIMRIENGKIVELREEADYIGLLEQLGMELKPKEAK